MAEKEDTFFAAPSLAIITGASKGIGQAISVEFAKRFEDKLHLILTARTIDGLRETASLIHRADNYSSERITIKLVPGDLGNEDEFPSLLDKLFSDIDSTKYQHAILVNNAGSMGDVTKSVRDFTPAHASVIQEYFFLNITSALLLSSKLLSTFPHLHPSGTTTKGRKRRTIVHMSSGAADNARASWSLYCTGKAARNMMHRVIAVEEPDVRVLSYLPGVVDTTMSRYAVANTSTPRTAKYITERYSADATPGRTAGVLCDLLHQDKYESGAIVDLYDVIGHPEPDTGKGMKQ